LDVLRGRIYVKFI